MFTTLKTRAGRRLGLLLCALLLAGALPTGAGAAQVSTVSALIAPDITVTVDGTARTFYNVSGVQVHPILYNGTTYLPLRAIGELMGKNVNWDQSTLTVSLTSPRTAAAATGTPDGSTQRQTVEPQLRPDFTVLVDGVVRTFADVQGNTVYPLLYNGTTYLPLRAMGGLMGKAVGWDAATLTASLYDDNGSLVTDADSFGANPPAAQTPPTNTGSNASGGYIGEERAKAIALENAGLSASQVTFIHCRLERDDGRWAYDVEFYTADNQEYDYEIDAYTGAILNFDYDADYWTPPQQQNTGTGDIGLEQAKSIALNRAGLSANQVRFVKAYRDYDDGRWEYEIEFISGTWEYEFEIDASTGTILSYERESIYD